MKPEYNVWAVVNGRIDDLPVVYKSKDLAQFSLRRNNPSEFWHNYSIIPMRLVPLDVEPCVWDEDEDGNYDTACNHAFVFNDESPVTNGFAFCPYCGKPLVEKRWEEKE